MLIWERAEPAEQRAPVPLSRAQIVVAGIRIADAEGLVAVSIRRVAQELGVRHMRLYSHVTSKDELLELMVDEVHGEIDGAAAATGGWRARTIAIARATRAAVLGHPWVVELLGGRPHLGPHALAVMEATASALSSAPGMDDPTRLRAAIGVLNSFLLGALRGEIGEQRTGSIDGMTETEWRDSVAAYLERRLESGRFPSIAGLPGAEDPDPDARFEAELAMVLAGVGGGPGSSEAMHR
jgi:AcrR family transcriptional regulator